MTRQPARTCVGCRSVLTKQEVIRIVAGASGIVIDYREKLPGRAAYVCPKPDCIAQALAKDGLAKALRIKVRLPKPEEFTAQLVSLIRSRIRSLLAMALKSGTAAAGYSAVHDALEKGRAQLVLYAEDLADGTREKLDASAPGGLRKAEVLTREDLGAIFSRELVGVVAVLDSGLAEALWNELERLKGLIKVDR